MKQQKNTTMESLEGRRHLSVTSFVHRGTLFVRGTSGSDHILVSEQVDPTTKKALSVSVRDSNGNETKTFDGAKVRRFRISAGGGNDLVDLGVATYAVDTAAGFSGVTLPAWVDGGAGDDLLIGGSAQNVLLGGGGDDRLLCGLLSKRNVMDGGDGDDQLWSGAGNDLLIGGAGNDLLDGGSGNDVLVGGAGDDSLGGGDGNDVLQGGAGSDMLDAWVNPNDSAALASLIDHSSHAGKDTLIGGSGTDTTSGKKASDRILSCETLTAENGDNGTLYYVSPGIDPIPIP